MSHPRVPTRGAVPADAARPHRASRPAEDAPLAAPALARASTLATMLAAMLVVVLALAASRGVEVARAHLVGSLGPAAAELSLGDLITLKGAVTAGDAARAEALLKGARE